MSSFSLYERFSYLFLTQSVNTLVLYKLRENKHTDILFEGCMSLGVLEGGQDGKRMSRRAMEPTGQPGGHEEDSDPSALLLCPSLRKKPVWLLQVYHTPEMPMFASSNPIHRETCWETDPRGEFVMGRL